MNTRLNKILVFFLLVFPSNVLAMDCWLNINTDTTPALSQEANKYVHKYGDVVNIRCNPDFEVPRGKGKNAFAWVKVTGLTRDDINKFLEPYEETITEQRDAYVPSVDIDNFQNSSKEFGVAGRKVVAVNSCGAEMDKEGDIVRYCNVDIELPNHRADRRYYWDIDRDNILNGDKNTIKSADSIRTNRKQKTELTLAKYEAERLIYAHLVRPMQLAWDFWTGTTATAVSDNTSTICPDASCDHLDVFDWEAATDNDLGSGGGGCDCREIGYVTEDYSDVPANDGGNSVTIAGATNVDSTHYRILTCNPGDEHAGYDDGSCTVTDIPSGSWEGGMINPNEDYLRIENLILRYEGWKGQGSYFINWQSLSSDYVRINNNVFVGDGDQQRYYTGINLDDASQIVYIYNNVFYDIRSWDNDDGYAINITAGCNTGCFIHANTIEDCDKGIRQGSAQEDGDSNISLVTVNNAISGLDGSTGHNIVPDGQGDKGGTWSTGTATTDTTNKLVDTGATFISDGVVKYNVVKDTTNGDEGYVTAVDSETSLSLNTDVFAAGSEAYSVYKNYVCTPDYTASGSNDFTLAGTGDCAIAKGADLDGTSPAIDEDWEGDTRDTTAPDVGFDEYVAAGAERRIWFSGQNKEKTGEDLFLVVKLIVSHFGLATNGRGRR